MNSESKAILDRIVGILEDKRGVSVDTYETEETIYQFSFGSVPGPNASADLESLISALLEGEPVTAGCKAYLQSKFIALVRIGLDTETTIAMSGIMIALEADDKKEYETEAFLAEASAMIYPEAFDIPVILKWGRDIESTYFGEIRNMNVSSACDYLEHFISKT